MANNHGSRPGVTGRDKQGKARTMEKHLKYLVPLLLAVALPSQADVYKYRDSEGNIHFTDEPVQNPRFTLVWHKGRVNVEQ